jgi:malonate decarboxylase beta subunit
LCAEVVMSEQGRLALSGPEVIETVKGVEEFDSRDSALVWRVTGGKLRRALGEATRLVDDLIPAFRDASAALLAQYQARPLAPASLDDLLAEHAKLVARSERFASARDGRDIWLEVFADAARVPELSVDEFNRQLGAGA